MTLRQLVGFHCRQQGTTLIEQIMLLAIVGILTGIAVPSLRKLLSHNQQQVAQSDFIAALQYARETALTTGKRTLFCPTRDGTRCSSDLHWENGWLLFQDVDTNNQPEHEPLRVGGGYSGNLTILGTVGRHLVRFLPDGSARGSNITLLFCQQGSTEHVLSVMVGNNGRIRSASADAEQTAGCGHRD
ncbi:MAG: GspH/FimT family pseudopilin [Rhodanobacter sp.]